MMKERKRMRTEEFSFQSNDGKTKVHAVKWIPENGQYKAILQITHGMVEYIERYLPLAEYLTASGFLVVGHDHIGHGQSVASKEDWGFFADKNPSDVLIADMHTLRTTVQKENQGVPYFMLGHSMGSYMLRKYLAFHKENLSAVIVMGTGFMPVATATGAVVMTKLISALRGSHYRSQFLENASFGGPYKKYDLTGKNPENSWLSKNVENVKKYYADPRCTFKFTANGYRGLGEAVLFDCKKSTFAMYAKDLPVFLVSGADDPVGDCGEGVKKVYELFKEAGVKDVSCKLYTNDRHEILNEPDHEVIFKDILDWMTARLQ